MTREEAIKALKWFKEYNEEDYGAGDRIIDKYGDCYYLVTERDFEAFDMAIKALEQEPILDKIREQIMSNLKGVDIALEVLAENHPLRQKMEGAKDTLVDCLELIDKAETEAEDGECK